jgi:hypothetical protein
MIPWRAESEGQMGDNVGQSGRRVHQGIRLAVTVSSSCRAHGGTETMCYLIVWAPPPSEMVLAMQISRSHKS